MVHLHLEENNSLMPLHVYTFKVRCPIIGGGAGLHQGALPQIWTRQTAYGVTELDAAREIIERMPEALELVPLTPVAEHIICNELPTTEHPDWCLHCGLDWDKHPVLAGTPEALAAREWQETLLSEGVYPA